MSADILLAKLFTARLTNDHCVLRMALKRLLREIGSITPQISTASFTPIRPCIDVHIHMCLPTIAPSELLETVGTLPLAGRQLYELKSLISTCTGFAGRRQLLLVHWLLLDLDQGFGTRLRHEWGRGRNHIKGLYESIECLLGRLIGHQRMHARRGHVAYRWAPVCMERVVQCTLWTCRCGLDVGYIRRRKTTRPVKAQIEI